MKYQTKNTITTAVIVLAYAYILFPSQSKYVMYLVNREIKNVFKKIDAANRVKHDRLVLASETYHILEIIGTGSEGLSEKLCLGKSQ